MNIPGLDYNTQREKLVMPEYGREIQNMVDYALSIEDREERQICAETIVSTLQKMHPSNNSEEQLRKFWDHLAIMSGFQLDIDYPFDISNAQEIAKRPKPLSYPMRDIPVRHYGKMMFELFDKLKEMPEGEERDALVEMTANHMKRSLAVWSNGSWDDEKVVDDLAYFTDGKIQLDLNTFRFAKIDLQSNNQSQEKKKKKK